MTVAGEYRSCPPSEVLAAFVDARLPRPQVVRLTDHLATCAECRLIVESVSEQEEEVVAPHAEPRAWRWQPIAAMVAFALVAAPFGVVGYRWQVRTSAMRAVREVSLNTRLISPRLADFEYASQPPGQTRNAGETDEPADHALAKAYAADLLDRTKHDPNAAHQRGVAALLTGDTKGAIEELNAATKAQPGNAKVWSDLSAAYYQNKQMPQAIAAADRAIALDPKLSEARFNKALATNTQAAWNDYLKHDPASRWAIEARSHLADQP